MVVSLDCATFKRDCGAEPQMVAVRPNLMEHQAKCSDCADFYHDTLALDVQLGAAFALPIAQNSLDEQLSSVLVAQNDNVVSIGSRAKKATRRTKQKFAWMGAAASVMLATFLFMGTATVDVFAAEVIEHIHHEPHLLTLTEPMSSPEEIHMVLKQANVTMKSDNIEVLAAKLCPFEGQLAAHLVVKGETGPVTLMILAGNDSKPGSIESNEFNGRILTAEHGTMAVVGGKRENVEQLSAQVSDAIQWLN